MSTPETNFETVMDSSSDESNRQQAIEALQAANECDKLAEVVRNDDVEDQYREHALTSLGHPQCESMLEMLVEDGDLPASLHAKAEKLLGETSDDVDPGRR